MDKLYLVIPAYNEEENIRRLIYDWYPIVENNPNTCVLVIDDGSVDDTLKILNDMLDGRPKLKVLTKNNGGHGDTLLYGYQYAVSHGADWIFQTDSDGQTKAEEFSDFWSQRNKYDAIFGNRIIRGDGVSRKIIEKVLCFLLKLFFGVSIPDANCPFRLMRADKVKEYIKRLPAHYFLPNVMLTVFFVKNDRVQFKEITFEDRKGGSGSINIIKIIKIGLQSIKYFAQFRKESLCVKGVKDE